MAATTIIKAFARRVVKEEITRLQEGQKADFFAPVKMRNGDIDYIKPRGGAKRVSLKTNMENGYVDFSNWVISKFGSRFPKEVVEAAKKNPVTILNWINQNPTGGMSPFQLRNMWKQMPALKKAFGDAYDSGEAKEAEKSEETEVADTEKDFNQVKALAVKVKKNLTGEVSQGSLRQDLGGVTTTTVDNIETAGINKIKAMVGYEPNESIDAEDMKDLLSHKSNLIGDARWEEVTTDAVDKYVQLLQAAQGDMDAFYDALASQQIISKQEIPMLVPQERKAVIHLMDLAMNGDVSEAEDLVLQDLMSSIQDNKPIVLRSFQNTLARIANPTTRRGRPAGSLGKKNKPSPDEQEVGEDVTL